METQHITFSEVPKKAQSKIKSGEFRATLAQSPHTNRRFCSLATSVAQKTGLCGARGFRGISSTGEKMPVCGIPRPLDRAGVVAPFCRQRKPSSHWYTMPPQVGLLMPSIQALWPLRGSLRAFGSAPLNPWFRFSQNEKRTIAFMFFDLKRIALFYYFDLKCVDLMIDI